MQYRDLESAFSWWWQRGSEPVVNLLIDDPGTPIAADADNSDKILYRPHRLYYNRHHHATDPTATYRDFAVGDLPAGYSWGGVTQVSPSASAQPNNRIIYSIPGQHFLRKVVVGSATWVIYTPPNWRGVAGSNSEADALIRAVGDVVYRSDTNKVQVATAFTARTPELYIWTPLDEIDQEARDSAAANKTLIDNIRQLPAFPSYWVQQRQHDPEV